MYKININKLVHLLWKYRRAQVMTLNSFDSETEELKIYIEQKINHSFLEKYIAKPKIDDLKLSLLVYFFKHIKKQKEIKRNHIISTVLVQVALDTHELVPLTKEISTMDELREKQLLVLAGDYYSGLYYLLLAEYGDFDMIHILAKTIKEINEIKMELYYNETNSFPENIDLLKRMCASLINCVVQTHTDENIQPFISQIIILNKLLEERAHLTTKQTPNQLKNFLRNMSTSEAIALVQTSIDEHRQLIETYLKDPTMGKTLKQLKYNNLYDELIHKHFSYVREGQSHV